MTAARKAAPPASVGAKSDINTLMSALAWQDSLLQSYRGLYYMVEIAMLGALVSLLVYRAQAVADYQAWAGTVAILLLFVVRYCFAGRMRCVVDARSGDVDYWQRRILDEEEKIPEHLRELTHFKAWQKDRNNPDISITRINHLFGRSPGLARRIFNQQLPFAFLSIWIAIILLLMWPYVARLFDFMGLIYRTSF